MTTEYGALVHNSSEGLFWWKDSSRAPLHHEKRKNVVGGHEYDWHEYYFKPPLTWQPVPIGLPDQSGSVV